MAAVSTTNGLWKSFVTVTGWSSHQMPIPANGRLSKSHTRSLSSILSRNSASRASISDAPPELPSVSEPASANAAPSTPRLRRPFSPQPIDNENELTTLPDPRSRAMSPASGISMTSHHHPDLDQEVATLSTKLINAINHQTTLDDNLSHTKMELEQARDKIRQLERTVEEQREMLAGDVWVRRKTVEAEKTTLLGVVAEEKQARLDVEQQKKKIEQELENLTAALFEEANKMVISAKEEARIEQEILQRKNDQLRAQLVDTEGLLKSQQEQLAELKHLMEDMSAEKDEQIPPTAPSSPGFSKFLELQNGEGLSDRLHHGHHNRQHSVVEPMSPSYPTSFAHLLKPVLRTDLASYNDFKDLIRTSKRLSAQAAQRAPTPSTGSALTSLGLGLGSVGAHLALANVSSTSLSTIATAQSTFSQTSATPASIVTASPGAAAIPLPALKDTKFYKRTLTEDIEPTLRLDTAPGLSWLARRSVLTAMTDGSLVVEPVPGATVYSRFGRISRPELSPCSLCGESRPEEEFLRKHRFRISETGSAQTGYALCKYCLSRVRSTCDFLGFLRIVKDGHWRADDEDAEKAAWTESVRLREQMFWSRIGGGVLPITHFQTSHSRAPSRAHSLRVDKSPRTSLDADKDGDEKPAAIEVEQPAVSVAEVAPTIEEDSSETEVPEMPEQSTSNIAPEPVDQPETAEKKEAPIEEVEVPTAISEVSEEEAEVIEQTVEVPAVGIEGPTEEAKLASELPKTPANKFEFLEAEITQSPPSTEDTPKQPVTSEVKPATEEPKEPSVTIPGAFTA
ncbi:rab guanine nucleotide exchange factor S2 [Neurospora sp. IMI 360204]|nr:rab guanine nucleotide exchange factor S2 [Neurospora sp. IMI 360204]